MKAKSLFPLLFLAVSSFFLSGCELAVTNLTPAKVPENPSGIYAINISTHIRDGSVIEESIVPQIIINGKMNYMQASQANKRVFEFDYAMPFDQNEAAYYFVIDYQTLIHGSLKERQLTTELYNLHVINRYVQSLETNRAPVGSSVNIMGRGFKPSDRVFVGDVETDTTYISNNGIAFTVPMLPAGRTYTVNVQNPEGTVEAGIFRIDASRIQTNQNYIHLQQGYTTELMLKIDYPAPGNGLPINITTDIPRSVIMEDVVFPSGSTTLRVVIQGGEPGEGFLYIEADGFSETVLPITVVGS